MLPRKTDERDEKQEEVWLQPFLAEAALDHPVPEGLAYDTKKGCSRAWRRLVAGTDSEPVWKSDDNSGGWHLRCHNWAGRTFTCRVNIILYKNTYSQSWT